MNNIVNTALSAGGMSLGERLSGGLTVFVIGIASVFAVLAILWGVLALFKIFFYDIPEKKKAAIKAMQEDAKANSNEVVPVVVGEETAEPEDDTQLIAVITAAIAAYTAESGNVALPFRVVSYKRVKGALGWNGADENETV